MRFREKERTVTVSMHKISAGDGYMYLVRQVAAADATHRGRSTLADYYSVKGEAPGQWLGSGLTALSDPGAGRELSKATVDQIWTVAEGSEVTEDQMKALFGEGLHPNADKITKYLTARGLGKQPATKAARLGGKFKVYEDPPFVKALSEAYQEYNAEMGADPATKLEPATKSAIKTRLARDWFIEEFDRPPADDRELSGYMARINRPAKVAVAALDLACSPVKSLSAAWAVAPLPIAQILEDCHHKAVKELVAQIESTVALTRMGANGIAQVDTEGIVATAWTHRDSRAGDPDLHTHLVISAKCSAIDQNGIRRWLALDAQPLHHMMVSFSEFYNTRIEHHVTQELGWVFKETEPPTRGKRAVREIVGIPPELLKMWSSRRQAIEARTAELAKEFQHEHGREPTAIELLALGQQATLETREAKHEPMSLAEQRAKWKTEAVELLGHRGLAKMLQDVSSVKAARLEAIDKEWVNSAAEAVIGVVSEGRARWQRHHILAEAQRYVRSHGYAAHAPDDIVERITEAALSEPFSLPHARVELADLGEPTQLRRKDGSSVFHRQGSEQFTSKKMIDAEKRIIAAAHSRGCRRATRADIDMALEDSALRKKPLNSGQVTLVEEMAAGRRKVALALAPAGSGKTTAMAALSHAWRSSGGNVIGLAPTAAAAIELAGDLNAPADTVAKYVYTAAGRPGAIPSWYRDINSKTMIIIDEVGKAGTLDLDAVISHALAKGACVRLVGDDGQLASVSAGGVLRDIATETDALTLSKLVRFNSESEAAATLALRAGDPAGLGFYIDNHRVHVGADTTAADMAYNAWRRDLKAGRDSLLLAPTNPVVDELNARARRDRLIDEGVTRIGREVILSDKLAASAGDIIKTRKNSRWLVIGRHDFVRNGYRYTIDRVRADGSLIVTHIGTGKKLTLPADYVKTNVTLGYASTVDLAQGLTAGFSCHLVGAANLTRQLLYVALTRGRAENHIYLSTSEQDPHRVLSTKVSHPETAVEALSTALARDGAQVSATTAERDAHDPLQLLGPAADMYFEAIASITEFSLGAEAMTALEEGAEQYCPGVTDCPAWNALRNKLALMALDRQSVPETLELFRQQVDRRELRSADLIAAVMHWRMERIAPLPAGPLQWLGAIPSALQQANPEWAAYLQRRHTAVSDLAAEIRRTAATWTIATAPDWAKAIVSASPALAAEIAVFRAAHRVDPADTRLTGPRQIAVRSRQVQRILDDNAVAAIGKASPELGQFDKLVDNLNRRIRSDGYWPQLATRLVQAAKVRNDIPALIAAAVQDSPLPDELPAAALWWRLAPALSKSAGTLQTTHSHLRPAWSQDLHAVFGSAAAEAIMADAAWPALVAEIAVIDPKQWTPTDLLHVAAEHIADADPDHQIGVHEYARLITYTIELFTTAAARHNESIPHPEHPPLTDEEHEALPPDPAELNEPTEQAQRREDLATDINVEEAPPVDHEPPPDPRFIEPDTDLGGLDFDELSTTRPTPQLKPSLANVYALRNEYATAEKEYQTLADKIHIGNGPLVSANIATIAQMRDRADADRPYLDAITAAYSEWADAEAAADTAARRLQAAQHHHKALAADPAADPRAIESARLWVTVCERAVPAVSPAEQYFPQIAAARSARADAAGGPDNVISHADVDKYLFDLRRQEEHDLMVKRTALRELREDLHAAEAAAARAFAAAETRSAEHITENIELLRTELKVLAACTRFTADRPLHVPDSALTGLAQGTKMSLPKLARLPFTVAPVRALPGRDTTAALRAIHDAAAAANRKILWCSPTQEGAEVAKSDGLADSSTTVAHTHEKITQENWALPAGSLLVIDDAAATAPEVLVDLIDHAYNAKAGVILLDTSTETWPPKPSARLMTLLQHDLPWADQFDAAAIFAHERSHVRPPDLDPILVQASRVDPQVMDPQIREALARREKLRQANRYAYKRHLDITAFRSTPVRTIDENLYPDLPGPD